MNLNRKQLLTRGLGAGLLALLTRKGGASAHPTPTPTQVPVNPATTWSTKGTSFIPSEDKAYPLGPSGFRGQTYIPDLSLLPEGVLINRCDADGHNFVKWNRDAPGLKFGTGAEGPRIAEGDYTSLGIGTITKSVDEGSFQVDGSSQHDLIYARAGKTIASVKLVSDGNQPDDDFYIEVTINGIATRHSLTREA